MKTIFSTTFEKQYEKLPQKIRDKFDERFNLFKKDPRSSSLRIHKGEYESLVSMNITGDYRALFSKEGDVVTFHKIGTHSQLY